MFALVSANVVNAVGDWLLIYGHWGFRAQGITGSGWSTCFARIYMLLVLAIALLWVESRRASARPASLALLHWSEGVAIDAHRIAALLKLGAPAAGQIVLEMAAFSTAAALCAKLGALALSGHQIALNCAAFAFMVPLGISSAASVRVGQQLGRGDPHSARRAGWSAILLGAGFMACAGLTFVSVPRWIARIFSPDPEVVRVGARLLVVAAAFQLFDGVQVVTTGALRGAGDTRTAFFANLLAYWVIGIPLGYFLCFHLDWGALGVWIGLCIGVMIVGSALLVAWHRKKLYAYGLEPVRTID